MRNRYSRVTRLAPGVAASEGRAKRGEAWRSAATRALMSIIGVARREFPRLRDGPESWGVPRRWPLTRRG